MPRSTTSRLTSAIKSLRSRGAMPAVGSSISSSRGSAGERDGELDPLDVAIGELAAWPIGGFVHADLMQQFERLLAMIRCRWPPQPVRSSRALAMSAICTFSATVIEPNVAAI